MLVGTLITGDTVVTVTDAFDAGVAIDDEEIVTVGDTSSMPDATGTVDVEGLLMMPDMIDPRAHTDDMFSIDTHETAPAAATLRGVTSYVDLAQQAWTGELSISEEGETLLEGIRRKREKAANAYVDYALHGATTREDPVVLSELIDAIGAGVSSFKMFTAYEHGLSNEFMHTVMEEVADIDAVGVYHTEDASLIDALTARSKAEGRGDSTDCLQSQPGYAEVMATEDTVWMAQETGTKYYSIHTSCRKSTEVLSQFHDDGSVARVETCTCYTTFADDVFETQDNLPMIAPPVRKQDDVEAMLEHLADGTLDVASTDHYGYKRKSKEVDNWWDSTFGASALQVSVLVFHDEVASEHDFPYPFFVRVMSRDPARIFGMSDKGTLDPGTDADVILFDPEEMYVITAEDNASSTDFSIHEDREATGRVKETPVRGELIANDGEIVSELGHGGYTNRELPNWDAWDRREGWASYRLASFDV